jgi:hypothetical protein
MNFFSLIPAPYRILVGLLLFSLYTGFIFYGGWKECSVREQAKQREQALAYADALKIEYARNDKIATDLANEKGKIHVVYKTITKSIPSFISPISDSKCIIPIGFISLHNSAAEGTMPATSSELNDTPSNVALHTVAEYITDNYQTCNEIRTQLIKLIEWNSK